MTGKLITGVDFYDTTYGTDRSLHLNDPPTHRYDLTQQTAAGYLQETLALLPTTDFAFGGRVQGNNTTARDKLDLTAPGAVAGFVFPIRRARRSTRPKLNMPGMSAWSIG